MRSDPHVGMAQSYGGLERKKGLFKVIVAASPKMLGAIDSMLRSRGPHD